MDMPVAAPDHTKIDSLVKKGQELQAQLQSAYKRIAELTEELEQLKK